MPRTVLAPNPSPMTLDGTRTYVVGRRRPAVVDPGPDIPAHIDAVAEAVGSGAEPVLLLTHRHPDHAEAADALARRLGARVLDASVLAPGERVATDAGELVVVPTPGHTPDHLAFHHPAEGAVYVGDLMMGGLDTALVAAPEGDLGEYLGSLARVRALGARVLYPAHGPPFDDPTAAIDRYVEHRTAREVQVIAALRERPRGLEGLVDAVYGDAIDPRLRGAATAALRAYLEHLARSGRVVETGDGTWTVS